VIRHDNAGVSGFFIKPRVFLPRAFPALAGQAGMHVGFIQKRHGSSPLICSAYLNSFGLFGQWLFFARSEQKSSQLSTINFTLFSPLNISKRSTINDQLFTFPIKKAGSPQLPVFGVGNP
jgi:hypothetical protein